MIIIKWSKKKNRKKSRKTLFDNNEPNENNSNNLIKVHCRARSLYIDIIIIIFRHRVSRIEPLMQLRRVKSELMCFSPETIVIISAGERRLTRRRPFGSALPSTDFYFYILV